MGRLIQSPTGRRQCVAVCCSVLQRVAVCGSDLCTILAWIGTLVNSRTSLTLCGTGHCSVSECGAVCCSALQSVAVFYSVLQCVAVLWQCFTVCFSVLQCVAVCCSCVQCSTVCCSALRTIREATGGLITHTSRCSFYYTNTSCRTCAWVMSAYTEVSYINW